MLWGYEIRSDTNELLGDEGDYAFESKVDAMLDALDFTKSQIREYPNSWENGIKINLQEIDESMVDPDDIIY